MAAAGAAAARAADLKGVRVIIFEGPCVNIVPKGKPLTVSPEKCRNCGICRSLCAFNAIVPVAGNEVM
jgi:TPP-dependent indolepyruvate ferredoxin oxidoreductase alpha subunit